MTAIITKSPKPIDVAKLQKYWIHNELVQRAVQAAAARQDIHNYSIEWQTSAA